MSILYGLLCVIGLLVGSFLNVAALRYEPGEPLFGLKSMGGRSRCPHCRKSLGWYELVPIFSWLIQRGRCRHCGAKLGWRYPAVELVAGLVTAGVPYVLGKMFFIRQLFLSGGDISWFVIISIIWIWVFYFFILLSLIDWEKMIIPDEINVMLLVLGLLVVGWQWWYDKFDLAGGTFLGGYAAMLGFRQEVWSNHLLAAVMAGVFFWLVVVLSRGKGMGWGDVKLAAVLGWLFGWPDILLVIILAFIIGGLAGLVRIIRGEGTAKSLMPFGPFLALSAGLTFAFGESILSGYFSLFGIV